MKKILLVITISVLTVALFAGGAAYAEGKSDVQDAERNLCGFAGCTEGELLADRDWCEPGSSASDWLAYVLAINQIPEKYDDYLAELEQYVTDMYAEQGGLHSVLATEYHRVALTVLALGGDPRAFGLDDEGQPVDLIADGTWGFEAGMDKQGLNGLVYALIALDSKGYEIPEDAGISREEMISQICDEQNDDGGFGFVPGSSDVDMTAMTLTALAPYQSSQAEVIDRALDFLSSMQTVEGHYESFGDINPESVSQVLIALSALGIDPKNDERFIKGGHTLLDSLNEFRLEDSTYSHIKGEDWDLMATEQALLALTALDRYENGLPGIYDLTDYEFSQPDASEAGDNAASDQTVAPGDNAGSQPDASEPGGGHIFEYIAIAAVVVAIMIGIYLMIRRRKCGK